MGVHVIVVSPTASGATVTSMFPTTFSVGVFASMPSIIDIASERYDVSLEAVNA